MVYEIGNFIRDIRMERGYSQEELCYGICSTGNLSKIENGIRMPNRRTIEALMQRLGCEDVFLQFTSKEEMYQERICKEIVRKLSDKEFEGLEEILEEFESVISEGDILNSQYCRFTKAMIDQERGVPEEEVIRELEEALQMTKPKYMKEGLSPAGLLTYNEIVILTNIANNYAGIDNQKAIEILFGLKKYMDTHILDGQERIQKYQIIIFNLSNILVDEKRYDEAIEMCNLGIENSKSSNRLRLFPYFLANKGFAFLGKGETEAARRQLRKSYHMWEAMDNEKECRRLLCYLKEKWNVNSLL